MSKAQNKSQADAFLMTPANKKLQEIRTEIFLKDPMVAKNRPDVGLQEVKLPGDACLGVGPTSSRVAVVDYNGDLDEVFEPARFRATGKGFVVGRRDPADNFKFHQVNVWAIITRTLSLLENERVFGRRIPWAFPGGRLLVLPHAGFWENAFYDRGTGALHFFYFEDRRGNPVYTCLSHDIVTHELGHAVLDGLKPYYNEISSPATAGFHEYFGDACALTSALSHREICVEVAGRQNGDLSAPNIISNIAQEFGNAVSPEVYGSLGEANLRSGLTKKTADQLDGVYEEHDYGEVMLGTYYDMLQAFYKKILSVCYKKGEKRNGGTRVKALMDAANLTSRLMLRALDYCPPVDINYLDYARAVNRADFVAYPNDPGRFRQIARDVFMKRKIIKSHSDVRRQRRIYNDQLRNLDVDAIGASDTDAYDFLNMNREVLSIPADANFQVVHVYRTRKVAPDGFRPPQEIIVEFVWSERVPLRGARFGTLSGADVPLWCGGTLVFDRDGNLLHYVLKENTSKRRRTLLDYMNYLVRHQCISIDDGETGLGARGGANIVSGTIENGQLRLSRNAAFRHQPSGGA